jgi:uncharacterized protein (TIGR03000 family)
MKRVVGLLAVGLVALCGASPVSAAAPGIGGIGGIGGIRGIGGIGGIRGVGGFGVRGLGVHVGDFGFSSGWASPRLYVRPWNGGYYRSYDSARFGARGGYYYQNAESWYYDPSPAYYPPAQAADGNAVTIRMQVPGNARIWFDGDATSQTGADRTFVSPSLPPGREYVYHIRVQWVENDKTVERTRDLTVHAGDRINLNIDR